MVVLSKRGTKNKEGGENGKRERRHAPEEDEDNRDRNARVERGGQDVYRHDTFGEAGAEGRRVRGQSSESSERAVDIEAPHGERGRK